MNELRTPSGKLMYNRKEFPGMHADSRESQRRQISRREMDVKRDTHLEWMAKNIPYAVLQARKRLKSGKVFVSTGMHIGYNICIERRSGDERRKA